MEGEKNKEVFSIHSHEPVTRQEFDELKKDLESYERRWVDQNKQIRKLREHYHGLRRWQSWILGANAVGFYVVGFMSKWILEQLGIKPK